MVNAMCGLMVGAVEHLDIMYKLDLDLRIKYTERILTGTALKNYLVFF